LQGVESLAVEPTKGLKARSRFAEYWGNRFPRLSGDPVLSTRISVAVVAATLAVVGATPVAASAADPGKTPSAEAVEHAKVVPGKPYGAGDGRKN
jgi:hypothetical protein